VARNAGRARQVPPSGIFGTLKRLERPTLAEGFDELHRVWVGEGTFTVEAWEHPGKSRHTEDTEGN
jgi:hypothetical protein